MIFKIYLKGTHENKFKGILSITVVELPLRSQSSTEWNGREKAKKKKRNHHSSSVNHEFYISQCWRPFDFITGALM